MYESIILRILPILTILIHVFLMFSSFSRAIFFSNNFDRKKDITRVDLAELIRGQKLKSKRIAYKFLIFNSFVKPSVKTSAVKLYLYLVVDKIKIK